MVEPEQADVNPPGYYRYFCSRTGRPKWPRRRRVRLRFDLHEGLDTGDPARQLVRTRLVGALHERFPLVGH